LVGELLTSDHISCIAQEFNNFLNYQLNIFQLPHSAFPLPNSNICVDLG